MQNASASGAKDGPSSAARSKEDLASAGRRKLEEFRNKRKNAGTGGARKTQAAAPAGATPPTPAPLGGASLPSHAVDSSAPGPPEPQPVPSPSAESPPDVSQPTEAPEPPPSGGNQLNGRGPSLDAPAGSKERTPPVPDRPPLPVPLASPLPSTGAGGQPTGASSPLPSSGEQLDGGRPSSQVLDGSFEERPSLPDRPALPVPSASAAFLIAMSHPTEGLSPLPSYAEQPPPHPPSGSNGKTPSLAEIPALPAPPSSSVSPTDAFQPKEAPSPLANGAEQQHGARPHSHPSNASKEKRPSVPDRPAPAAPSASSVSPIEASQPTEARDPPPGDAEQLHGERPSSRPPDGSAGKRHSLADRRPFATWLTGGLPPAAPRSQPQREGQAGELESEGRGAMALRFPERDAHGEASRGSAEGEVPATNGGSQPSLAAGAEEPSPPLPPLPPLPPPSAAPSARQNGGHSPAGKAAAPWERMLPAHTQAEAAAPDGSSASGGGLRAAQDKSGDKALRPIADTPSAVSSDFGALEQHIEDLTQEKFALQRSLDAGRALAESLAQENAHLMQEFNARGAVVAQLRDELEELRGELKATRAKLAHAAEAHERALQEREGAQERSQALAAEVIALEERALRLRSRELKLERELEGSAAEIESHKRVISTLEKDRANLRSLIDGLQEEKRALQHRLRQAAAGGALKDTGGSSSSSAPRSQLPARLDVATSTADFEGAATATSDGTTAEEEAPTAAVASSTSGPAVFPAPAYAGTTSGAQLDTAAAAEQQEEGAESAARPRADSSSAAESAAAQTSDSGSGLGPQPSAVAAGAGPGVEAATDSSPGNSGAGRVAAAMAAAEIAAAAASAATPRPILPGAHHLSSPRALLPPAREALPEDELRCLDSIFSHIAKVGEEHRAMARALEAEATAAAELRALNLELSRKLTAQTQRLELALTQNLLSASPRPSQQEPAAPLPLGGSEVQLPDYLDEGDEVAERVLGWILQLLPGGRAKKGQTPGQKIHNPQIIPAS